MTRAFAHDRGSMSLLFVAALPALLLVAVLGYALGAVLIEQNTLGQLADEAARAGRYADLFGSDACVAAQNFVGRAVAGQAGAATVKVPGPRLESCYTTDSVVITLSAELPQVLRRFTTSAVRLRATARAG